MSEFNITSVAQNYLTQAMLKSNQGSAVGIRVGVKKAGCSGYEYILEYVYPEDLIDNNSELDFIFEQENVKIIIDKAIYQKFFKGGTVLDYRKEGLNEGLKFDNPNVASKCGCGESFNLVED